jgi:hypothetical protein
MRATPESRRAATLAVCRCWRRFSVAEQAQADMRLTEMSL